MDDVTAEIANLLEEAEGLANNGRPTLDEVAAYLVAKAVTVQQWIPASEPPKVKGCYFVTVLHWFYGNPVTREAYWNGEDWLSCEKRHELTPRVTHWMPLPKAPGKEDF